MIIVDDREFIDNCNLEHLRHIKIRFHPTHVRPYAYFLLLIRLLSTSSLLSTIFFAAIYYTKKLPVPVLAAAAQAPHS